MKCKSNLGKIKRVYLLNDYSHIMSNKIRKHLEKRELEKLGIL